MLLIEVVHIKLFYVFGRVHLITVVSCLRHIPHGIIKSFEVRTDGIAYLFNHLCCIVSELGDTTLNLTYSIHGSQEHSLYVNTSIESTKLVTELLTQFLHLVIADNTLMLLLFLSRLLYILVFGKRFRLTV